MRIGLAQDMDELNGILKNPYIWAQLTESDIDPNEFYPEMKPISFWMVAETDEICGIMLVLAENTATTLIHPYMLEKHKGKGYYMIKAFFEWYLRNAKEEANKINAKIPAFNKAGRKVALKVGFKDEGVDRQSYLRDGKLYDQYLLGITRDEIKEVLKWEK